MKEQEFKELEEKYMEEIRRRNRIETLKNKVDKFSKAIESIKEATDSPYESIGSIKFTIYGTSDGRSSYVLSGHDLPIDKETAISIFEHEIKRLNKQLEELDDESENE